jgi:TolA-binding protein
MHISRRIRFRLLGPAVWVLLALVTPAPAHAVSKEIVELQTQVQQLLDMVQRLQSTLDTRFGVIQHLAEQTADEANRTSAAVNALQQKLNVQADASSAKLDTQSGQIQSLNDSVDEVKSRLAKLEKSIADLQGQLQSSQSGAGSPGGSGAMTAPGSGSQTGGQAPPLDETYQSAVRDYNAAKYQVAAGEFQDVVRYYSSDEHAGMALFYLGEISYRQQDYAEAIKLYSSLLDGFPGCPKAPAARLHKGLSLIQTGKKDAGVKELRLLIQRSPQTPEAGSARSKLNGLGVRSR